MDVDSDGDVMMSRSRASQKRAEFLLKVGQYLCLILALVCLGNVALDYARARIFQSYQSWRFDRVTGHKPVSEISKLMGWIDHAFTASMNEPAAGLNHDRFQTNAPTSSGRGPVPAAHSLPMGTLLGRLEIPKLGISVMVLEGDGDDVLRKAVGHVPTTAFPGGQGNVVIAGHRDTFFRALRKIRKDDEIIFTTAQGAYNYQVGSIEKVGPQDVQVLKASLLPTLTLVTCYPFDYIGPAPQRFIVQATEAESSEIGGPDHSIAGVRPTLDSHSGVRAASSSRRKKARLNLSRRTLDSSRIRIASTPAGSNPVMEGSKSTPETTEAQQVDPLAESPPTSRKIYRKVRAWLSSIPSRLRQD
jgi:sortase A